MTPRRRRAPPARRSCWSRTTSRSASSRAAFWGGLGYRIVAATDGRSALAALDETPEVDLLFTDVVLPGGMGGVELAREARRRRPGIKVLFTTGYAERAAVHQGRLGTDDALIEKPYRKAVLARKLRAILGNEEG